MTDDDHYRLLGQIQRQEDAAAVADDRRRFKLFRDSVGVWTIGWGTNVETISREEADYLLANRLNESVEALASAFVWFKTLDSVRQAAVANIFYNLGLTRFLTFEKALRAMAKKDYGRAADEFFDSKWATQVGHRAVELTDQIRTGEWSQP